jgi:hypothetical protein
MIPVRGKRNGLSGRGWVVEENSVETIAPQEAGILGGWTVKGRIILTLAAGSGLLWLGTMGAAEPTKKATGTTKTAATAKVATVQVSNQEIANAVASRIKASGVAKDAVVQIKVDKGIVDLAGVAVSSDQQQSIAQHAMAVEGVREVVLSMKVQTALESAAVTPVSTPMPMFAPMAAQPVIMPVSNTPAMLPPNYGVQQATGGTVMGGPLPQEPMPMGGPGGGMSHDPYGPKLPAHSWPTYAPYSNMSRVGYPQAYPYNAFPYIGPFYPFPKVPLGWRTVQLTWEDGHWYMGRVSTPHDYWRVRFW